MVSQKRGLISHLIALLEIITEFIVKRQLSNYNTKYTYLAMRGSEILEISQLATQQYEIMNLWLA